MSELEIFKFLANKFESLGFGLIVAYIISLILSLSIPVTLTLSLTFALFHYLYFEFGKLILRNIIDKVTLAWQLNSVEKKRYNYTVQEYVTLKLKLEKKLEDIGEKESKIANEAEEKYSLNDSFEMKLIEEFRHRIIRLIEKNLSFDSQSEILKNNAIERIIKLFDAYLLFDKKGNRLDYHNEVQLYEKRLNYFLTKVNWKEENIYLVKSIPEMKSVNELFSLVGTFLEKEIFALYLINIEESLMPYRFNMTPYTYLDNKRYLIRHYSNTNFQYLDLPDEIDDEDIIEECKYRVSYLHIAYIDNLINEFSWKLNYTEEKNNKKYLKEEYRKEIRQRLQKLNLVDDYLSINKDNILDNKFKFLDIKIIKRYFNSKKSEVENGIFEYRELLHYGLDLPVINKADEEILDPLLVKRKDDEIA